MIKAWLGLLLSFCYASVYASGISLTPPITDSSVVFLGNLFGVVDGVLSGTGSQIMGAMMGVFNAAVLALGGIVITYTVLVGTMNTAQEGKTLGEKWSSVWIPLRSTIGLTLLMPKATGYCLMQIFIMWVVVQGVGAADIVWNAALGYLDRGGVIIQAQQSPVAVMAGGTANPVALGGLTILTGQVCMLALQQTLTTLRQYDLNLQAKNAGPCYAAQQQGDTTTLTAQFCNTAVPDFISSVNAVSVEDNSPAGPTESVSLPNLSMAPYKNLNGICGNLTWNVFTLSSNAQTLVSSETATAMTMTRAAAVQQYYSDLASVATKMVGNAPDFATSSNCPGYVVTGSSGSAPQTTSCYSLVAIYQYGMPYYTGSTGASGVCGQPNSSASAANCQVWGSDPFLSSPPLFSGTEFMNAMNDYNAIMAPALNLNQEAENQSAAQSARAFIAGAESTGWIMAGSYYYDLVQLSGSATSSSGQDTDTDPGFPATSSYSNMNACMTAMAGSGTGSSAQYYCNLSTGSGAGTCPSSTPTCALAQMMAQSVDYTANPYTYNNISASSGNYIAAIQQLITYGASNQNQPSFTTTTPLPTISAYYPTSSSVWGFLNDESIIVLPGQPGLVAPSMSMHINIVIQPGPYYLPAKSFSCGGLSPFYNICIGQVMGNLFYNDIIRAILNFFLDTMVQLINAAIQMFLSLPLQVMSVIFTYGMESIQQTGNNPILSLAMMGTTYINASMELWIYMIEISVITGMIPVLGPAIMALISMVMPLLISWMGVMVSIGFTTAYYVPFVPYINFLFGSIAWFSVVIEAMVAGPVIALGVTNPEGHEAFGKGESAIMLLLNVFLRPALMVIGFVMGISLSYVCVWVLNEGFENALGFMGGAVSSSNTLNGGALFTTSSDPNAYYTSDSSDSSMSTTSSQQSLGGYNSWAGIYAFFFAILMYTTLYLTLVQNAFNLIYQLPDKVLRWIGGGENVGQEAAQWKQDVQGKMQEGSKATEDASGAMTKQMQSTGLEMLGKGKKSAPSTSVSASGSEGD